MSIHNIISEKGLIRDMDTADLMDYGRELLRQTAPRKGLTTAVYSEYLQRTGRNLYEDLQMQLPEPDTIGTL